MKRSLILLTMSLLAGACTRQGDGVSPAAQIQSVVDASGAIHVPANYREQYRALGSWSIAGDSGKGAKQLHTVYASPGAIEAYRKSGEFPAGTVLIKEVYDTATAPMTTGTVSRSAALKGWFVMVRAKGAEHAENPLWGDGWGWSWFDADKPGRTTSTDYKSDCLSCHEPAHKTGLVYTEGYPQLH